MVVYDCTDRKTFESTNNWLAEAQTQMGANAAKILVANKCDLTKIVENEEGEKFARAQGVKFIEVSAKTGLNINEAFEYLIEEVMKQMDGNSNFQGNGGQEVLVARKASKSKAKCLLI